MGNNKGNPPLTEGVYYILLSLTSQMHGYGIMQFVSSISKGRVTLAPGTLYGAINSLISKGWIQSINGEDDSRKKEYKITKEGLDILNNEIARLEELVINGKEIMEGINNEEDN